MDELRQILQQHSESQLQPSRQKHQRNVMEDVSAQHGQESRGQSPHPVRFVHSPAGDHSPRLLDRKPFLEVTNHVHNAANMVVERCCNQLKPSPKQVLPSPDQLLLDHSMSASNDVNVVHAALQRALKDVASLDDALRRARLKSAKLSLRLAIANRSNDTLRQGQNVNIRLTSRSNSALQSNAHHKNISLPVNRKGGHGAISESNAHNLPSNFVHPNKDSSPSQRTCEYHTAGSLESQVIATSKVSEQVVNGAYFETECSLDQQNSALCLNKIGPFPNQHAENVHSSCPKSSVPKVTSRTHSPSAQTQVSDTAVSMSTSKSSSASSHTPTCMSTSTPTSQSTPSEQPTTQGARTQTHTVESNAGRIEEDGVLKDSSHCGQDVLQISKTKSVTTDTAGSAVSKGNEYHASTADSKSMKKKIVSKRVEENFNNIEVGGNGRRGIGNSNRGNLPRRAYSRRVLRAAARKHARLLVAGADGRTSKPRVWPSLPQRHVLLDPKWNANKGTNSDNTPEHVATLSSPSAEAEPQKLRPPVQSDEEDANSITSGN